MKQLPPDAIEADFLNLFIKNDFVNLVVQETNRYAEVNKHKFSAHVPWTPVTKEEIRAYLGIVIYMGIVKLPTNKMYFIESFVQCKMVSQCMTFTKFLQINRYVHLVDEVKKNPNDYFWKVKPALDLMDHFRDYYQPGCPIAIGEAMIGFQGRLGAKQ